MAYHCAKWKTDSLSQQFSQFVLVSYKISANLGLGSDLSWIKLPLLSQNVPKIPIFEFAKKFSWSGRHFRDLYLILDLATTFKSDIARFQVRKYTGCGLYSTFIVIIMFQKSLCRQALFLTKVRFAVTACQWMDCVAWIPENVRIKRCINYGGTYPCLRRGSSCKALPTWIEYTNVYWFFFF